MSVVKITGPAFSLVYRCLDASGEVVYVGKTTGLTARLASHRARSPWWPEVVEVAYALPMPEAQAREYEIALIVALQPRHNKASRDGSDNASAAREASLMARAANRGAA